MSRRGKATSGPLGARRGERAKRSQRRGLELPHVLNRLAKRAASVQNVSFLGLSSAKLVILAMVTCGLALTLAVPLRTYFQQRDQASVVAAERVRLEKEITKLQARKDQQADPAFVRAQARERLRLVMPGETPVQVQLPGAYEADQAKRARAEVPTPPWYISIWNSVAYPPEYQWDSRNPTGPGLKVDPIDPIDPIN